MTEFDVLTKQIKDGIIHHCKQKIIFYQRKGEKND